MATAIQSPVLDRLRPGSGWALDFAQVVAQADSGTQVFAHRVGARVFTAFGRTISQPPSPTDVASGMIEQGYARAVYYMEVWEHDTTVLGTGYIDFWYIGVYSN